MSLSDDSRDVQSASVVKKRSTSDNGTVSRGRYTGFKL